MFTTPLRWIEVDNAGTMSHVSTFEIIIPLLTEISPFTAHELKQLLCLYYEEQWHDDLLKKPLQITDDLEHPSTSSPTWKEGSLILKLAAIHTNNRLHLSTSDNDDFLMQRARLAEQILPQAFLNALKTVLFEPSEESYYVMNASGVHDVKLLKFLEGMAIGTGRRGPSQVIDFLYDSTFCSGAVTAFELVNLCYLLGVASSLLSCCDKLLETNQHQNCPQSLITSLARLANTNNQHNTIDDENTVVSRPQFREWINCTAPLLASTMPTFLHHMIFMGQPFPKSRIVPFRYPDLGNQSSVFFGSDPYSPLHFCFGSLSHTLCTKWRQLYCLEYSGSNFSAIQTAILGYNGPMLMIIGARGGGIFGAYTSSQWKTSGDFFGHGECFLYSMDPCVNVYRPTGNRNNYMYCNPSSRVSHNDGKAHGIGFGGTTVEPRLFIPESSLLDDDAVCRAGSYDLTYEQGPFLPGPNLGQFQIDRLEIWGVGDSDTIDKAVQARDFQKTVKDANLRKAQTIADKTSFMDDLTSGFIATKLVEHRELATDRDSCR